MTEIKTASDLFAKVHGSQNQGPDECHWCGAACQRIWPHDEPLQFPFQRNHSLAKRPGNGYICQGCWLYRRKRVTVNYYMGGYRDGQTAADHSWLVREAGDWVLCNEDYSKVYEFLLKPPIRFFLSLRSTGGPRNELHCTLLNDQPIIRADTGLYFTLDNVPQSYTIYELEMALKHGDVGRHPGVQTLIRYLGPGPLLNETDTKQGRGRPANPKDGKVTHKIVRASGVAEPV